MTTTTTITPQISLSQFQASDFNVATLVESLMEEDVKRAKAEGGGEFRRLLLVSAGTYKGLGVLLLQRETC